MSTLDDWLTDAAAALSLPGVTISPDLRAELLDLTRDVAHGVARVAGPLTCYLIGMAVTAGAPPANAIATLRKLAAEHVAAADGENQGPAVETKPAK